MKWNPRNLLIWVLSLVGTGLLVAGSSANEPTAPQKPQPETRQKAKENLDSARENVQDARESKRDDRQDARGTTRDDRQDARGTLRDDRQHVAAARQDRREARREFRRELIRSADIGLWLRRLAGNRSAVADVAPKGVAAEAGFHEGDQIVSVNGYEVATEREFIDHLFAEDGNGQPVKVVIMRDGKEMTLTIQPRALVEEFMAAEPDHLLSYGIIVDQQDGHRVVVNKVLPRSPAFYAGLRSGDVITGFRGQRIAALADLIRSLTENTGSTSIHVHRNNQPRELEIEIPGEDVQRTLKPNTDDPNVRTPADAKPSLKPATPATPQPRLP